MFANAQWFVVFVISLGVLIAAVWALIDAMRYSNATFVTIGKNKALWRAILGAAAAIAFISMPPPLGRGGGVIGILGIAAIAAVVFYFVDVRKKLQANHRPGGGRPTQRGGW